MPRTLIKTFKINNQFEDIKSQFKAREMQMASSILGQANYQKSTIKVRVFVCLTDFESLIIISIVDNIMREIQSNKLLVEMYW